MLQPQIGSGLNFTGQRPANPVVCVFLQLIQMSL